MKITPGMDVKAVYAYNNQYQREKYDRVAVLVRKGKKEELKKIAAENGMSLNEFINMCIVDELEKMGLV